MPVRRFVHRSGFAAAAPRPPWAWALAGALLGLVCTLVLAAPAHWLAQAVGRASGQQLQLQQARGSLWQGSAHLVLTGGANSHDHSTLPSPVHWQLRPRWDGAWLQLRSDCCTTTPLALRLRLGWGQWALELADGRSHWPAALLSGLGTPWNTLRPQGQLALSSQGLRLYGSAGRLHLQGQMQVDALHMSSRLSTLRPMGSYRLSLDATNEATPRLQLHTLEGALLLQGQGQWVGARLRFTGQASAAPGREAALANLLNIIGRRNGAHSVITLG